MDHLKKLRQLAKKAKLRKHGFVAYSTHETKDGARLHSMRGRKCMLDLISHKGEELVTDGKVRRWKKIRVIAISLQAQERMEVYLKVYRYKDVLPAILGVLQAAKGALKYYSAQKIKIDRPVKKRKLKKTKIELF
jgi:hypothetical protein